MIHQITPPAATISVSVITVAAQKLESRMMAQEAMAPSKHDRSKLVEVCASQPYVDVRAGKLALRGIDRDVDHVERAGWIVSVSNVRGSHDFWLNQKVARSKRVGDQLHRFSVLDR